MTELATTPTTATHPLDPLSADEITAAMAVLRDGRELPPRLRITSIALEEPAKSIVRAFRSGDPIERVARIVCYDRDTRTTAVALVSITNGAVTSWEEIAGVQPHLMLEEFFMLEDILKADERYVAALATRGVTDLDKVQADPWPAGNFGSDGEWQGRRVCRAVSYVRDRPDDNGYAHPIENFVAIVDFDAGEVLELIEGDIVPVPEPHGRYDVEAATEGGGSLRTPAPLDITQPDGPGFTLDGQLLTWERWSMRVSVAPIEGLVLHQITWHDDDGPRPILYRAALGDMVVPYGSTATNHWWKNAFDAGEIGLGQLLNSLELGCDCLGEIRYLDSVSVDQEGQPFAQQNTVCIHEEDFGMLWKHWDFASDSTEVRRSRRLVVSSIATVGNYEYAFYWHFYLDGNIELLIKMTGIVQTQALADGEEPVGATRIGPNLAAPHHQHMFCVRLDVDVDGGPNTVSELDVVPVEGDHPHAFDTVTTTLTTEQQAQRISDAGASRTWLIENHGKLNAHGQPVAYRLMPGYSPTMLAQPGAAIRERATFATQNLWVTPFDPDERHPAGDFPARHPGGDGLPRWTAADRSIEDTDIVVWHTFGATHIVRPEDYPVMPVEMLGFMLKPNGFFDRNPALDLAPSPKHCD
ncbi:MAG: primary-amine oxidase [Ilumatobacter sp.]|uniref:primary-amine oxidase n=1 Tax=Ilumatobacter sp. TaxID=1967498 RepID=UPI00260711F9|nr:primary-amine oxidase [Ilumatobacter sp.]MDJ0767352.1 primary-amine oxidase [Ilumatobacter sp.]